MDIHIKFVYMNLEDHNQELLINNLDILASLQIRSILSGI